ncbi:MAG: hypothetical protein J6K12_02380, partial [Clostridia bacterium]|nr:hypothetical protein [Clostridia bacterium]
MTKKVSTAAVLVCIALFIPLAIAVIYGLNVDPNSVAANNLKRLSVTYEDNTFSFEDSNTFDLYSSISQNAREIDGTFRDFSLETPYTVTYTEDNDTPITYLLYMSKNMDDCVYVSPDGQYFMMDEEIASKLVVREEFSSLNEFKSLPVGTISGFGEEIVLKAESYTWTYTALDNNMVNFTGKQQSNNPLIKFDGSQDGTLTINFDKTPDALMLNISGSDGVVFDDKYENLSASSLISYNSDTKLILTITAQWYEIESAEFFGETVYTVPLLYDVAP